MLHVLFPRSLAAIVGYHVGLFPQPTRKAHTERTYLANKSKKISLKRTSLIERQVTLLLHLIMSSRTVRDRIASLLNDSATADVTFVVSEVSSRQAAIKQISCIKKEKMLSPPGQSYVQRKYHI